jgi:hypothetical protein
MVRRSPFATGFRALRREPSVLLAEIGWRWIFGGIASALIAWGVVLFLKSVEVPRGDQLLLQSMNPAIVLYVLRDLIGNRWWLLARLGLIASISLSFTWVLMATIARAATTRVLVDFCAEDYGEDRQAYANFLTVGAIHFARVALLWIGLFTYLVSAIVAMWLTSSDREAHTAAFVVIFLATFLVAAVVLAFCNWILLLAPIFAIRDAARFFSAVRASWRLTRTQAKSFVGLNLAHLAMRLVWIVFISGIGMIPLGFAQLFPASLIIAAVIAITLLYCAVSDVLFVARYAGYIMIAEQQIHPDPEPVRVQPPEPVIPQSTEPSDPASPPEPAQLEESETPPNFDSSIE